MGYLKDKFQVISNRKIEKKNERMLLSPENIKRTENENMKILNFSSDKNLATWTCEIQSEGTVTKISYVLERVGEGELIFEIEGEKLSEEERILASSYMLYLLESFRFFYKQDAYHLSKYLILDKEGYERRKEKEFLLYIEEEIQDIQYGIAYEELTDYEYLYTELEDTHSVQLKMCGEDAHLLCEFLQEKGMITFERVEENLFWIEPILSEEEEDPDYMRIKSLLFILKGIAKYEYNIWLDYRE